MTTLRASLPIVLLGLTASSLADEPRPAITIRLDQPDRQVRAVIDLFRGSKAAHPAAALAAWKRASVEPNRLGKPAEALIAAFNPAMAEELRVLDGAELALWFDPGDGRPTWGATLPKDDGSIAAMATAMVLSGGAAEAPVDGLAVDRLGPPGSPLMARAPRGLLVAGSPDGLKEARIRSDHARDLGSWQRILIKVDPEALEGSKSLAIQRLNLLLRETRRPISGVTGLVGSSLIASFAIDSDRPREVPTVEPDWLDWLPADRAMAAFAVAIDPSPANWDAAFRLVERVEKVDPARGNLAPLRLRLDLLGRAMGFRADGELLPHLKGMSGWLGTDGRSVDRACLILHLDGEAVAARIFERVKPLPNNGPAPVPKVDSGRWLGQVEGRPIRLYRFGQSVAATWGEGVMEASLEAADHRDRSAGSVFRKHLVNPTPAFVAAVWPGRVPGLIPANTPLAVAVTKAPPVVWSGDWLDPGQFRIEATWSKLDDTVKAFLDRLPLDPPPDH